MASSQGLDSELESFRQQWLSEVRTKQGPQPSAEPASPRKAKARPRPASPSNTSRAAPAVDLDEEDGSLQQPVGIEPVGIEPVGIEDNDAEPEPSGTTVDGSVRTPLGRELVSALDHYEEAMAKEAQGNMGDSLKLYRRAYRMDHRVDRRYREKHFPSTRKPPIQPPVAKPSDSSRPAASAISAQTVTPNIIPNPSSSPKPDSASVITVPIKDLIASFSSLQIQPAPPQIEDTPPPPCPISTLPRELLVHILHEVALQDIGDFARLSLVCKPFAYLVPTEQHTWRDVCLGTKFGFTGMHYHWHKSTDWTDLSFEKPSSDEDESLVSSSEVMAQRLGHSIAVSKALVSTAYTSWKHMFRSRPRIRFNGCYISTVNYVRMGQASTNQATWGGSPVHIVTYYRYLRFFRDGTAISLLTTSEPSAVVPHLTRESLLLHQDKTHAHLPSAVMQKAYKGRWRLSRAAWDHVQQSSAGGGVVEDAFEPLLEGDLTVETESHDPKYMFRMDLSLRTAGRGARNNKAVWRSHFSYNKLTDDWAEFTLKHDKAFFFSRVRSYGTGE
ncbi:hypothetical protein E4U41_001711 [Claviceps citrina]|nr:hypothetical protein E4U41_001711 [Claviceps citrina]